MQGRRRREGKEGGLREGKGREVEGKSKGRDGKREGGVGVKGWGGVMGAR